MKCHSSIGTADPDECSWRESGKHGVNYVMVLRIFFVMGPPAYEEIGRFWILISCIDLRGVMSPFELNKLCIQ